MQKKNLPYLIIAILVILTALAFSIDQSALKLIPFIQIPFFNSLFTFFGTTIGAIIFLVIVSAATLYEKKYRLLLLIILAPCAAYVLSYIIKEIIHRPRPLIEAALLTKTSFSFPSSHAAFASATILFIYKLKTLKIPALILAIITIGTGFYNGVHYLSDILAGITLGLIVSYLTLQYAPKIIQIIKQKLKTN